jgi:hypothetical protein
LARRPGTHETVHPTKRQQPNGHAHTIGNVARVSSLAGGGSGGRSGGRLGRGLGW